MAEWGIFTSIPKILIFSVLLENTLIKWNLSTIKHYWQNGDPLKHPQNFIIFRCIWRSQYQVESVLSGWDGEYFWKKKTHGHFIFWKAWTLFLPLFFFFCLWDPWISWGTKFQIKFCSWIFTQDNSLRYTYTGVGVPKISTSPGPLPNEITLHLNYSSGAQLIPQALDSIPICLFPLIC